MHQTFISTYHFRLYLKKGYICTHNELPGGHRQCCMQQQVLKQRRGAILQASGLVQFGSKELTLPGIPVPLPRRILSSPPLFLGPPRAAPSTSFGFLQGPWSLAGTTQQSGAPAHQQRAAAGWFLPSITTDTNNLFPASICKCSSEWQEPHSQPDTRGVRTW